MKKLSDLLSSAPAKYQLSGEAVASQVLSAAEKYLIDHVGRENIGEGKNISAKKFQRELIFFEVHSSAWNHRLFQEKMGLLELLHREFPKLKIRDVRGQVRGQKGETEHKN